jgi:hypothetical protein
MFSHHDREYALMTSEHSSSPTSDSPIRQWDGALPFIMSAVVLLMIVLEPHTAHHDEGAADHIAMLLMYGQIPIMLWFVAPWRHRARRALPTLLLQLALWAFTFALAVVLSR